MELMNTKDLAESLKGDETRDICNECGRSVAFGSGNYVNRVPSLDDEEAHREMGKPFPKGGYICAECEAELDVET